MLGPSEQTDVVTDLTTASTDNRREVCSAVVVPAT